MPDIVEFVYKCDLCGKKFKGDNESKARSLARECETTHDVVYVRLLRSDVQRLLAFISSGERELLTETLVKTLRSYRTLR